MTEKTHGGARLGAGRKAGYKDPGAKNRSRRLVMLSEVEASLARQIGAGNLSYGIRRALYLTTGQDPDKAL